MRRQSLFVILLTFGIFSCVTLFGASQTLNFAKQSFDTDLDTYCKALIAEGYKYLGTEDNAKLYEGTVIGVEKTQVLISGSYDKKRIVSVVVMFPKGRHWDRERSDYEILLQSFTKAHGTPTNIEKDDDGIMAVWKYPTFGLGVMESNDKSASIVYFPTVNTMQKEDQQQQRNFEAINWYNNGVEAFISGDYAKAESDFLHSIEKGDAAFLQSKDYISAIRGLANTYEQRGKYAEAEEQHEQLKQYYFQLYGDTYNEQYIDILGDIRNSYNNRGDYTHAEEISEQIYSILKTMYKEPHEQYALYFVNKGVICMHNKNYTQALPFLKKALQNLDDTMSEKMMRYKATIYNNLCICYSETNMQDTAIFYGRKAIGLYKAYSQQETDYATALANMAYAYSKNGAYMSSYKLNKQAQDIFIHSLGDEHELVMQATFNVGTDLYNLKRYDLAQSSFEKTIQIARKNYIQAMNYMSEYQREKYWNLLQQFLEHSDFAQFIYHRSADQPSVADLAYDKELFSKGLLLTSGNMVRQSILESKNASLIAQYNELIDLRTTLASMLEAGASNDKIDFVKHRVDSVEKQLTKQSAVFRQNETIWQIDWHSVQHALQPNQVAIEYSRYALSEDSIMYCALIVRDSIHPVFVPLFEDKEGTDKANHVWSKILPYLKGITRIYFSPVGVLHQTPIEYAAYDNNTTWSDHYEIIRLSSTRELAMTPKAEHITSASLFGGIYYDVDTAELSAQSAGYMKIDLAVNRSMIGNDSTLRAGVRYLPGTKTEVESINSILRPQRVATQLLTSTTANEESFKALSGKHKSIIHIATHGFYWSDSTARTQRYFTQRTLDRSAHSSLADPLQRSGLLFAGSNIALRGHSKDLPPHVQDGILTAKEISLLDLRGTDMVVLSACETGKGEITGDGVFGLQRAFKMAGVQTILMSLWPVDDHATQLMMTSFYEHWITRRENKREAFRHAQIAVKQQYADPIYWAAFVLLD